MFGIDEIYNDLLLEAKTPEEIKKILHYQFVDGKGVPEDVFESVLDSDPTKKKNYTRWVLMQWNSEGDKILSAIKLGQIKELFNYFKERSGSGLELGNMKSFSDALSAVPSISDDPIFGIQSDYDAEDKSNNFDIVFDSMEWRIAVPNSVEASVKLGMGCKWCTAGAYGNAKHYYNTYTNYGKLWVNFDKRQSEIAPEDKREYPYKRYQFCFEARNGAELNDAYNERINIEEMNIPQDVFDFYGSINEDYVYDLEDSVDGEISMQRRHQRMLENCILRKNGTVENNELLLLPLYDGNEIECYRMFLSRDLEDSIDANEYGEDSVYDACEGFPFIFMNNGDYKTFNVYRENTTHRRNWNGETVARYNWYVEESVRFCGGNNVLKYFFGRYDNSITIAFGNSVTDIDSFDLGDITDEEIENVTEITSWNNLPHEYKNGVWLQIGYENELCGLWYIDNNKKDIIKIIEKDVPLKGEDGFFKLENTENGCVILSRTKKYSLGGESNNDGYHIVKNLEDDEDFYIVSYNSNNGIYYRYYGLYDSSTNEMLVKDVENIEDYGKCVLLDYEDFSIFYDYNNRKYVTEKGYNITDIHRSFISYIPIDDDTHYRVFDSYELTDSGPFDKVLKVYDYAIIKVVSNGAINLYDTETSSYILPNGAELIDTDDMLSPYLFIYKLNGESYLYSSMYRENILKLAEPYNIKKFGESNRIKGCNLIIEAENKKFVVLSSYGETLIPFYADDIIQAVNQTDKKHPIAAVKDGKVYFAFSGTFVAPKNGLPYESFVKYSIVNNSDAKLRDIIILVSVNDKKYKVFYTPFGNKITNVLDVNNNEITDTNELKNIEKLFFPEKAQVSEQFKNIIDRMDRL